MAFVLFQLPSTRELHTLREADPRYLLLAVGTLVASFVFGGVRLQILANRLGRRLLLHRAVRIHLLGVFSASVTPGGSGGFPALALALQHHGVASGSAWACGTAVLAADTVFSAWATPAALLALHHADLLPRAAWVAPAGIALSVVALAVAALLAFRLRWVEAVVSSLFRGPLTRFRRRALRFARALVRANGVLVGAGPGLHAKLHLLTALGWAAFFAVLWALAHAFGLPLGLWQAEAIQVVVTTVSAVVPTPGGSGFFEVAVAYLVRAETGAGQVGSGGGVAGLGATILAWRLLTYYAIFLVGPLLGGYLLVRQVQERPHDGA